VTNQRGMPTPSSGGRLTAEGAGRAASIESASGTAGVGGVCVAGDVAAATALATCTAGTGGAGQRGLPRRVCRIHSVWPKRDESLIELLRRTDTSKSARHPTINWHCC